MQEEIKIDEKQKPETIPKKLAAIEVRNSILQSRIITITLMSFFLLSGAAITLNNIVGIIFICIGFGIGSLYLVKSTQRIRYFNETYNLKPSKIDKILTKNE